MLVNNNVLHFSFRQCVCVCEKSPVESHSLDNISTEGFLHVEMLSMRLFYRAVCFPISYNGLLSLL